MVEAVGNGLVTAPGFRLALVRCTRIAVVAGDRDVFATVILAHAVVGGAGIAIVTRDHLVVCLADTVGQTLAGETIPMKHVIIETANVHQDAIITADTWSTILDHHMRALARQRTAVNSTDVAVITAGAGVGRIDVRSVVFDIIIRHGHTHVHVGIGHQCIRAIARRDFVDTRRKNYDRKQTRNAQLHVILFRDRGFS